MEETRLYNQQFFSFLKASSSPFHAVREMAEYLEKRGFQQLIEEEKWLLQPGHRYYTIRDDSALIAFNLGTEEQLADGFRIVGAHTDSPCLQVKPIAEVDPTHGELVRLAVEVYGGALLSTWFDRDLSLAGRVFIQQEGKERTRRYLIDFTRPLLTIPSLAIHLDREANTGIAIDRQKHLPPLLMQGEKEFNTLLREQLFRQYPELTEQELTIVSFDLFCRDSAPPCQTGGSGEFISAGKLDNLLSCFAGLQAIGQSTTEKNTMLFCANHEENGSLSSTGANGNFLHSVLERLLPETELRCRALASSFLISMDNAHASHPNYPEKMDAGHEIRLNYGPVVKFNANQRYATSAASAAVFYAICRGAGLSAQKFVMRSDMPCGSTIGPMTAARLGIRTVDIGAASLAMHSIRELTGHLDPWFCYRVIREFYIGGYHR